MPPSAMAQGCAVPVTRPLGSQSGRDGQRKRESGRRRTPSRMTSFHRPAWHHQRWLFSSFWVMKPLLLATFFRTTLCEF